MFERLFFNIMGLPMCPMWRKEIETPTVVFLKNSCLHRGKKRRGAINTIHSHTKHACMLFVAKDKVLWVLNIYIYIFKPWPRPSGLRRFNPDRDLTFLSSPSQFSDFPLLQWWPCSWLTEDCQVLPSSFSSCHPQSDSNRRPLESGADCQFYQLSSVQRSPIGELVAFAITVVQ